MAERTCDVDGCDRKHQARGMCTSHWSAWYRQQFKDAGHRSHHKNHLRTCATCGGEWYTPRPEAKFCTAKCKGVYLSELNRRKSILPADHPVMELIAQQAEAKHQAAEARRRERESARAAANRSKFEWRTERECPGCACRFTPIYTPNMLTCSKRCQRRVTRWRRKAAERGAPGSFTWSEFMRIARKFDYCCAYCSIKPARLDPDHVVPLSRGGSNSPANLLPACNLCNSNKCAMSLSQWAAWRAERGLPPRVTSWQPGDRRYSHLTDAVLDMAAAA